MELDLDTTTIDGNGSPQCHNKTTHQHIDQQLEYQLELERKTD